jgi:ABC-type dipeptide/oligopeptide/nickel transport system permease subunit
MSAAVETPQAAPAPAGRSLWSDGLRRLRRDRLAMACFGVIMVYAFTAMAAALGWVASPWDQPVGPSYAPPSFDDWRLWLGTDMFGRSVLFKTIHGTRIAMSVGLVSSLIAIPIGVTLGALAGYFGRWVDEAVVWFYTVLSSIPGIMLLTAIAMVLGKGTYAMYVALGVTSWVGLCRVMRGEFIKHKNREYVLAAASLGASHASRIFRHILPNVSHFVIIFLSMMFMSAIKAEVILSFLGWACRGSRAGAS